MAVTAGGTPYVESSDLVANYPGASLALANRVDQVMQAPTQNAITSTTYTAALLDAGKTVTRSNAAASTHTIPAQATIAWAASTQLNILNIGAGTVTITPAATVTINGTPLTLTTSKGGSLVRTASNTWTFVPFSAGVGDANFTNTATDTYTTGGIQYKYITFTGSGSLVVDQAGFADVLVIGGGGGGSTGGGGAGAYVYAAQHYVPAGTHTVTIGAGAAAIGTVSVDGSPGTIGGSSNILDITAPGGGGGGVYFASAISRGAQPGGAGGGGPYTPTANRQLGASSFLAKYGFNGGPGHNINSNNSGGGGGGGASAVGGTGNLSVGGNGGAGAANSITGSAVTRAGGGGGGRYNGSPGSGGAGGGGAGGSSTTATSGTANTGGGGGGSGDTDGLPGAAGGSGIVIVRVVV